MTLTSSEWDEIRRRWDGGCGETFEELAHAFEVSRSSIVKRAIREEWKADRGNRTARPSRALSFIGRRSAREVAAPDPGEEGTEPFEPPPPVLVGRRTLVDHSRPRLVTDEEPAPPAGGPVPARKPCPDLCDYCRKRMTGDRCGNCFNPRVRKAS